MMSFGATYNVLALQVNKVTWPINFLVLINLTKMFNINFCFHFINLFNFSNDNYV